MIETYNNFNDKYEITSLAQEIENLGLDVFVLSNSQITNESGDVIIKFKFTNQLTLKKLWNHVVKDTKFNNDKIEKEIIIISNTCANYIKNNQESPLNNCKISLEFRRGNSDTYYYVCNFDKETNEKYEYSYNFDYVDIHLTDISLIKELSNVQKLKISCKDIDDLLVFEYLNDLKYLNFNTSQITENNKKLLINLLPGCTIICNGENIQT